MGILESMHEWEVDLFRAVNQAGSNPVLDAIMVFFTVLGISYVIALICVPLWFSGRRESAVDSLILIAIVTILTEVIKVVVDRPRPLEDLGDVNSIVSASGPSFPSAHASRAFAVAFLLYTRESKRIGFLGLVVASIISISRVYLGVHWPTDVLAGAVLGILLAVLLNSYVCRYSPYMTFRKKAVEFVGRHRD